jgi:nuclear pore complex protein Nup85
MHLAQVVYIPQDGRGDGIVSEELVDFLNTTSPWPTAERQEALTTLAAPFEKPDFWGFIYTSIMRGHLSLASTVLKTLLSHPSTVLQRLTQACLDLLSSLPRSNSPLYAYESAFLSALRAWRNRLTALLARLDMDMDEFQEEIEAQEQEDGTENEDESMEACADERFEWQAGFGALLKILSGDVAAIVDASEDGWKSALTAWCLLVRPGLKRDDLP